ncbi:MAG: phosphatidate cytidylyltransferase [Candidatus Accumulibacter sp.]|jgi:phosphatidate cytidylyltransferase|nr:phosphatidate cytidylyltransferase [Accumulibacter sp.]
MLKTRIITAIFLLAGLLGALFFLPDREWIAFCALIGALAAWEWGGLAGWGKKGRIAYGVVLGGGCCVPWVVAARASQGSLFDPLALLMLLAVAFWLLIVPLCLRYKWPLRDWSAALTGIVVLLPPTLSMGMGPRPLPLLAWCAIAWVADIAAYFSGRAFGGKKLAPNISPGKTWAGAVGALIGVSLYCNIVVFCFWDRPPPAPQWMFLLQLVFIGLAVVSIMGDLFESLLKRQAGLKDSSRILPGHGGILDRIDSLTSTLPCLAPCLVLLDFIFPVPCV